MASWVLCRGLGKTLDEMTVTIPHDLYVFGSQENSVCDREWVESLRAILKDQTELDYKPVRERERLKRHTRLYWCLCWFSHLFFLLKPGLRDVFNELI